MSMHQHPLRIVRLGCALAILLGCQLGQAQTRERSVRPATQPAAPTSTATPNPAGLTSQFPAGLPSPLPSSASPSPPLDTQSGDLGLVQPTTVMGAGVYGAGAGGGRRSATGVVSHSAVEVAQSFIGADANRDGELTRAEAQRLTLLPYSFEEMDRNFDGVISRSEYEDSMR